VAVAWVRDPPSPSTVDRVHTFDAAQIRALYLACDTLFERILLTALFTTGMRINGFCSLVYPGGGRVGADAVATEKGNVRMVYGLSTVLQRLLQEWVDGGDRWCAQMARVYLFPNRDHPDCHVSTSWVRRVFHRIAARANVCGGHVHPHTCRHTDRRLL
jgi:site-specific recombinase XerD